MSIVSLNNSTNPSASANAISGNGQKPALDLAAEQFEAMFLQQVLKQMRKASDVLAADNPMRSREMDTMRDFYDGVLSDTLASKRQTGIADMLVQQLSGHSNQTQSLSEASDQAQAAALPERRSAAMDNSLSLNSLRNSWQRGVALGIDGLENLWDKGSAGFKALVDSVIKQESGGRVDAVSHKGALGVMQLMPDTARQMAQELGIQFNLQRLTRDADYNKQLGTAFLGKLLERYDGEQALALAAYNAGPARVDDWLARNGDPRRGEISSSAWVRQIPFKETRDYTSRILAELGQSSAAAPATSPAAAAQNAFNNSGDPVALSEVIETYRTPSDARQWRHFPGLPARH
ncbi:MAG: transglycosylase SLT domain-containing protein [Pseudomonadota bacterium]|nr:transglycosylase SLT domain-containing protein [Pseudomonadota bacterium]